MNTTALSLYRQLFRQASRFRDYNIRSYAMRSVRTRFRENLNVSTQEALDQLLAEGKAQLEVVKRQAAISELYGFSSKELVIEKYAQ
mmetsp:Transcript_37973/g.65107  ORF Transcript_37973/g.65107 Transcript_37973/m.65107 type:complete len:87 (+) Transcript_37973:18-278(+)